MQQAGLVFLLLGGSDVWATIMQEIPEDRLNMRVKGNRNSAGCPLAGKIALQGGWDRSGRRRRSALPDRQGR